MKLLVALIVASVLHVVAQDKPNWTSDPLHRPLDELLDLYVRDGFVYYNALRSDRSRLDRYIAALNSPAASAHVKGSREQQLAFWINAYNAFVLRTVVDHFPIRGRASQYPAASIRQIPGAFDRVTHRAGGRTVTLDAIEKEILMTLGDARAFLALGRGAVGSGRLRSEAYDAARLDEQFKAVAAESVPRLEPARERADAAVRPHDVIDRNGTDAEVAPRHGLEAPLDVLEVEQLRVAASSHRYIPIAW